MSSSPPQTHSTPFDAAARKRTLTFVFLTVFLDLLGVGILVPVIPYLVRQFRTDAFTIGMLSLSFSAAQFLASPVLGVLSDRVGRRPVLLVSILGSGAGYFLFGWAGSIWVMFLARIIDGITGGNISTAQACIADISAPEDRTKNFGLIGMAFGLGFIVGPGIGGLLSKISLAAPAFGAGGLSLFTFLFGYFALPETHAAANRRAAPMTLADLNPFRPLRAAFDHTSLRMLFAALFFLTFAFMGLQSNFSLFTLERLHFGPDDNAWVFVFIGLTTALMQGVLVRRLSPIFGEKNLALAGFGFFFAGFVTIANAYSVPVLFLGILFVSTGSGLSNPTMTALISNRVSGREQGTILGTMQSVMSLARIIGPVWAGFVYDYLGQGAPYSTGAGWIAIAGVLAGIALLRDSRK